MTTPTADRALRDGWYHIRVKGHLASRWTTRFDAMTLTPLDDGTTLIEGPVADQAALHGLIQQVRDTGLPLVSVIEVNPDQIDLSRSSPATQAPPTEGALS